MDNVPYHSVRVENYPKANKKKQMSKNGFLKKRLLETMSELLKRVKLLIPKQKTYEFDQIALKLGHEVLRLSPYHCQYNSIKLIWAQVKPEVVTKNISFKISYIEKFINETLDVEKAAANQLKLCKS